MRSRPDEIVVGREQRQFMADAKLREKGVDRAELHPHAPTTVAQVRGVNVVLPVRNEERQGREPLDDVSPCARASEPLQEFLQDQPRGHHYFAALQGAAQGLCFRRRRRGVSTKRERPDARIDEQAHPRERSPL